MTFIYLRNKGICKRSNQYLNYAENYNIVYLEKRRSQIDFFV